MEGVKMRDLLKKGDVFVINRGVFAGKYVVSCVEENTISTMPTYESRVWCLQLGNLEKGICFNQSDGYKSPSTSLWTKGVPYLSPVIESLSQAWQTSVGEIKVIGHATQETPGKWNVKYFDKKRSEDAGEDSGLTPRMISNMINNAVKDAVEIMTQKRAKKNNII